MKNTELVRNVTYSPEQLAALRQLYEKLAPHFGITLAEDPNGEIARILRAAAAHIEAGNADGYCFDLNGNKVGSFGAGRK